MQLIISISHYVLILIFLCTSQLLHCKVRILTFSYNKPEFIELQYRTFKKFLKDDFEMIVFNDATKPTAIQEINDICTKNNIKTVLIPQEIHDRPYLDRSTEKGSLKGSWTYTEYHAPSVLYSNIAQFALDEFGFDHNDIVVIFESDLFLVKEFSFKEYLYNAHLAGYNRQADYKGPMSEVPFLWIGLLILNMPIISNKYMFNLNCGFYEKTIIDCGGYTHDFIKSSQVNIKYLNKVNIEKNYCKECNRAKNYRCDHNTKHLKKQGFDNRTIAFIQEVPIDWGSGVLRPNGIEGLGRRNIEFFADNHFVHFCGATGYANCSILPSVDIQQFHKDKTNAFLTYINDITTTN